MTHRFPGLHLSAEASVEGLLDGLYLVRVERAQYRWHRQKPFYALRLNILEPQSFAGRVISGHLYCTAKALWKLGWFLRDFGYDAELLTRDEVKERSIFGLRGVVKISHSTVNGFAVLNLDGFAPANQWKELSPDATADSPDGSEVAS